jgi:hypothetical protein
MHDNTCCDSTQEFMTPRLLWAITSDAVSKLLALCLLTSAVQSVHACY